MQFFCDESGQTGSNYLDTTQPFYVLGGWIKPDNMDDDEFKSAFHNLRAGNEVKSSKLVRSPKGRETLLKLINMASEYNFIPIYCIVEKRFAISARMVEELLDPKYNDLVPNSATYDEMSISKYDLAMMFYKLPDNIINDFAKNYSKHDISGIIDCINRMIEYFDTNKYKQFAKIVENSLRFINSNPAFSSDNDNTDDIFSHKIDKEKAIQSVNWFTFYTLISILDDYAYKNNKFISIVHDEQKTYDVSFLSMFNVVTKGEDYVTHFQNNPLRGIKNKLTKLDFAESVDSEYIQMADVLVGSWNYILKYGVDGSLTIDESTQRLAEKVLSLLKNYRYLHWMISEKVTSNISNAFKLSSCKEN
ncbi:DUF3800 domain-containing protein [Candidatus Clostridium helianthi]|uniref:DUF3800 domain-containing protein n=1 Tax=Candidatus Clostridium helianthi TaxID=3381660 RepID=A0ABW8S1P6_9CLOT